MHVCRSGLHLGTVDWSLEWGGRPGQSGGFGVARSTRELPALLCRPQMSAHIPQHPLGAESRWVRKSLRQEGEERRGRPRRAPVLTQRLPH